MQLCTTIKNFLSGNQLTGSIPESLSTLVLLTDLSLNNNHLSGAIPDSFQQLPALANLDLSANNLSGPLPPSMAKLSSISTLHLEDNQLTGVLDVLQDLPLIDLDIENNLFSGPIPPKLLGIPNFRSKGNPFNTTIIPSPPAESPLPASTSEAQPPGINPVIQARGPSSSELPHSSGQQKSNMSKKVVWIAVGGFFILVLLALGLCVRMSKWYKEKSTVKVGDHMKSFILNLSSSNPSHPKETQRIDSGRHNSLPRSNQEEEKIQTVSKNPPPTLPPQPLAGEGFVVKPVAIPTTTVRDISKNIHFPRFFSVASLQHYTNSFSQENLIGKGMLGSVYKAGLPNGKACRARYEDLQQRYMGCKYWYNELRDRRVAELKRELEKSEETIGLLVSKLKKLKAVKGHSDQIIYASSHTESPPVSIQKTKGVNRKTVQKERSKDEFELSAGSFTHDLEKDLPPKSHSPSIGSSKNVDVKLEVPESSCMNTVIEKSNEKGGTIRKRRGKRKRKDGSWDVKEGIVERENLGSSSGTRRIETSTSGCCQTVRSSSTDLQDGESCRDPQSEDLVEIFNSVTENQYALVFRRRLDSQKRARYRKTIKQHMDLDTIRSSIANNCIKSTRELFKDLFLIANNALVFYSKRTREYKSGLALRSIVTKRYKELCNDSSSISSSSSSKPLSSIIGFPSMSSLPVRPRSIRPRAPSKQPRLVVKFPSSGPMAVPHGYMKLISNSDSSNLNPETEGIKKVSIDFLGAADPKATKKGLGRPRRVGGGGGRGSKQPPLPRNTINRKRAHQK